ncbi:MAG: lytic transglycosylase domain-containing protein [Alphaproteobacteria bacterium]|nr:lytic transglycosylase domain-containing protein [Alphaproteobacteria bacterium]
MRFTINLGPSRPSLCHVALTLFLAYCLSPSPALAKTGSGAPSYRDAFAAMDANQYERGRAVMLTGGDPILNKVLKGQLMALPGNDYSFDELAGFVSDNPDWPGLKGIMMIAEQKIPSSATNEQVVNWFNTNPPLTMAGFYRYIDALDSIGKGGKASEMIRARWIEKDFGTDDFEAFRSRYATLLTSQDHVARLDRLLWANNITASRAMYPYVSAGHQALAEARMALATQKSNVNTLISRVPASLQRDSGLLFERLRWRRKNDDTEGAIEILLNKPDHLGHTDLWWDETNIIMRRLIEQKDFKLAYRIVSNNKLESGFDYIQAEFTAGWLALRFLNKLNLAHKHFSNILSEASSPVSRARGYYWIGRTYEAAGQKRDAEQAYQSAAMINTTFYGQLAIAKLYKAPLIRATSEPPIPANVRNKFFKKDSVQAVSRLYRIGQNERARSFFRSAAEAASQRVEFALMLELAYRMQRPDWAVNVAKVASQKNIILTGGAYPILDLRIPTPPELALTHALIRQESQFKADAGSPVGARGLMQLMPGTAKDVAKKLDMRYSPARLIDPDYNVKLGTYFIQKQIDNFDGSYVLALAGYNAGPRRAREWVQSFGDPRSAQVDTIDWIELIPIYETRNYVQRILENLQFYRARLSKGEAPLLILHDLKR